MDKIIIKYFLLLGLIFGSFLQKNALAQITTVAGCIRTKPGIGDGELATEASLYQPETIAISKRGTLLIGDRWHYRVREVDTDGIIRTIAGVDTPGYTGDGGPAKMAAIGEPGAITADKHNNIYVSFPTQNVVRKIDTNGIISTIAGTGEEGFSGDGDSAIKAQLYFPTFLVFDYHDNLLLMDGGNYRIRKINQSGIITTIAGIGTYSSSGDEGPATDAEFYGVGMAVDHIGNIYIADPLNNFIRKIDNKGIIHTIAGNGKRGPAGDGGLATAAELAPYSIEIDGGNNLFISEGWNHILRKIDSAGYISTICGDGTAGFLGDGGDAKLAKVNVPCVIALDQSGNLFFGDAHNFRVRKITNVATPRRPLILPSYNKGAFNVYPNPSTGIFIVERATLGNEVVEATIYDLLGRAIIRQQLSFSNNNTTTIKADPVQGNYILELIDETGEFYRKRIVIE